MIRAMIAAGAAGLLAAASAIAGTPQSAQAPVSSVEQQSGACHARPAEPPGRPRVGLVLGGGGARGIAHISVLRTLEQMRVPIDCIAGTSMGSLVGALYASGMSVDEIEKLVLELDWEQLFNDSLERPERSYRRKRDDELVISQPGVGVGRKGFKVTAGLLGGERILLLFEKLIEPVNTIEDFDNLPIPYRAVAADINTGAAVVIQGGDLALAMRASMSIPGAFPPVQIGDKVLVDGGVARNLPVDVVRNMGADVLIAVDVGTPLSTVTTESSVLSIADQILGLLTVSNTKQQIALLTERDVLISPPLGKDVATGDFEKGKEALVIGQTGVDAVRDRLAALSVSESGYAQNRSVRTGRATTVPVIQFVRLENKSRYSDTVILARIEDPVGKPLDSDRLERDLYRLFGFNTLSLSSYEVVEEAGKTGVVLHVTEKVQGPNYIEVGLSAASDFEGRFDFNLRFGVLQSPINASGGEVRYLVQLGDETQLLAEYYQPFGGLGKWFFATRAEYDGFKINTFDSDGNKVNEFEAQQFGGVLGVGKEFGNYGAVTLGYRRFTGDAEVLVGDPTLPDIEFDTGQVFVEGQVDRLDSFYFPRDGYLARTRYTFSRDSFGADTDFEQLDIDALGAKSFGRHAFQLGGRYHATTSGIAPIQSLYRLGGYSRLAGFKPNELTGQHYFVVLGGYLYQFGRLLGSPAYLGGSIEYGNAFQSRSDMDFGDGIWNGSAYLGVDSTIGPIQIGVGAREGGEQNVYLTLGQRF